MNIPLEIVVETSQSGFSHPGLPVHFLLPGTKTPWIINKERW